MDRIRKLCYNLGNCTLVVYPLKVSVITCYEIETFNLVTPNPGGAANLDAQANNRLIFMDIKKYSSLLVGVIVEDISYIPSRSYGDEYLSVEEWFIMMNEFLIYDLHICDRFLFARWGNDLREKLMKEILELISKRMEEVRDQVLNNQLKNLSLEKFPQYLQTLRATPTREWITSSFNQKQIELRPYKLIKEYPKNKAWDGLLEWEYAKKLAALLKKEKRESFVVALGTQAMGILPKFAMVREVLE